MVQKKEVLSCRITPELKEQLAYRAESKGLTTSNYVESLILDYTNGEHISENREEEYIRRIEILERQLVQAEQTRAEYEGRLDSANLEVEEQTQLVDDMTDTLNADADYRMHVGGQIKKLNSELSDREEVIRQLKNQLNLNLTSGERAEFAEYLNKLRANYPEATDEQIVVGSLYAAADNEKPVVVFVSRVNNFLKTL